MTAQRKEKVDNVIGLYQNGAAIDDLSVIVGWSTRYLKKSLKLHHEQFGSLSRKQAKSLEIKEDAEIIRELINCIGIKKTARKYNIDPRALSLELAKLHEWVKPTRKTITLSRIQELVNINLDGPVLVTRQGRPLFYVTSLVTSTLDMGGF